MKNPIPLTALCALLWVALLTPGLQGGGTHVNKQLGYRIKTPKNFVHQAESINLGGATFFGPDPYLVDRFECSKPLPPKSWLQFRYNLQMVTFWFPKRSAAEIARAREEETKRNQEQAEGTDTGRTTISLFGGGKLYQSFEEYASERIRGFFFDQERPARVAGFDAVLYQMKFEKLANVPQRWMACSYQVPGGEFTVLFTCTEGSFDKFKSTFTSSFKSFKLLDPAGLNSQSLGANTLSIDVDFFDEDQLSAGELLARRETQKREAYEQCIAKLPGDWRHFESEHFLVAYECPPKYARQVARQAEAVIAWLGDKFGQIGSGIIQGSIIRVFEQEPDRSGVWIVVGSGDRGRVREIRFARPESRGWSAEFQSLNRSVMSNWFNQKNPELWRRMPFWLESGLGEYIEDAELKGSRIRFGTDQWEQRRWNDAKLAAKRFEGGDPSQAPIKPLKLLMSSTLSELTGGGNWRFSSVQCSSLVRYLLEGPGSKHKQTRSLLSHYIGNLYELVEEVEARIKKENKQRQAREEAAQGLSEEEQLKLEDEEYKQRREQAYDSVARELLDKAFTKTFKGWSNRDWAVFDSSWRDYADGKTR